MIVQAVDAYKEFLPAEYWISRDSVDAYIGKIGRNANLKRASEKKYNYLQTKGLVKAKSITEADSTLTFSST